MERIIPYIVESHKIHVPNHETDIHVFPDVSWTWSWNKIVTLLKMSQILADFQGCFFSRGSVGFSKNPPDSKPPWYQWDKYNIEKTHGYIGDL